MIKPGRSIQFGVLRSTTPRITASGSAASLACFTPHDFYAGVLGNVDALHSICKRQGLRIVRSLQDKDYGLRASVFEDPDGNRIDVGQPIRKPDR